MVPDMNEVNQYIAAMKENKQKEWVSELVHFMREAYPSVSETFSNNMPTYKGEGFYIAFVARSSYFSFYTSDQRVFSLIQDLSPTATLGKNCARIKYSEYAATEILMDVIKVIVDYHQSQRSHTVTDIEALRKWKEISPEIQQLLLQNVFCSTCGVTKIVDYTLHNDRFGVVLEGKCKQCGNQIARLVEDN